MGETVKRFRVFFHSPFGPACGHWGPRFETKWGAIEYAKAQYGRMRPGWACSVHHDFAGKLCDVPRGEVAL